MNEINIEGVNIAYEIMGKGDKTILFIHGWMDCREDSDMNFKQLSEKFKVIRFDLPGHGDSGKLSDYSFENYIKYTARFIEELNLDKINLIGHSMGCVIATRLAEKSPQKFDSIILIDPPLGPLPNVFKISLPFLWLLDKLRLLPMFAGWLREKKRFQNLWCNIFIGDENVKTARAREITITGMVKCDPQAIVKGIVATLNNDMIVDVTKVRDNYYVIYGDKDPVINVVNVNKYFRKDRIKVFTGEYHVPNRTDPVEFNEYVTKIIL